MARHREYVEVESDSDPDQSSNNNDSDEESEEDSIDGDIPEPSKDAGVDEYQKLLKAAQLSLNSMKIKLAKSNKANSVENKTGITRRRTKDIPEEITQHDKLIKDLGRRYAIMISPWVDLSFFGHDGRPSVDPLQPDRYKTKASQQLANIAELYDFTPKILHPLMEKHTRFGDLFRSHVSAMRSTAIHGVREQGYLIFGLDGTWIASGLDRSTIPELQELITVNGSYNPFPRILFPDDSMKMKQLFRNEALPKILRMIFFGPSSLRPNNVPRPKTNAEIWKVSSVTAGSIALSAILARFLLSPDSEFSPKGATTGIDYLEDFHLYKRTLLSDSPRMKELFDWYNKKIFARNDSQNNKKAIPSNNTEETFDELIRAFNEESDEETAEENEDSGGSNAQVRPAESSRSDSVPPASSASKESGATSSTSNEPDTSTTGAAANINASSGNTSEESTADREPTAKRGRAIKPRGGGTTRKTRNTDRSIKE